LHFRGSGLEKAEGALRSARRELKKAEAAL